MPRIRAVAHSLLKGTAITLTILAVALVLCAQAGQYLLRYRAGKLLADFQSIQLQQSNWSDSQRLMRRWGAFGSYEGSCTSSFCAYRVVLLDPASRIDNILRSFMDAHYPQSYSGQTLFRVYERLGGHYIRMQLRWLVEDGLIRRSGIGLLLSVPPHVASREDSYGYSLMLSARASDRLRQQQGGHWVLGSDEELAQHPDFKEGRPGGCEICMAVEVTFTPSISQPELRRVTGYDLSCITRLIHACTTLPQVLPAAAKWPLYSWIDGTPDDVPAPTPPIGCDIPFFAMARDAAAIWIVDVLSSKTIPTPGDPSSTEDLASIRIVSTLEPPTLPMPPSLSSLVPYSGSPDQGFLAQHLQAGKRYIVLGDPTAAGRSFEIYDGSLHADRCGIEEDTAAARAQVAKGLAQHDPLRNRPTGDSPIW